jgi:hypothetical protein
MPRNRWPDYAESDRVRALECTRRGRELLKLARHQLPHNVLDATHNGSARRDAYLPDERPGDAGDHRSAHGEPAAADGVVGLPGMLAGGGRRGAPLAPAVYPTNARNPRCWKHRRFRGPYEDLTT